MLGRENKGEGKGREGQQEGNVMLRQIDKKYILRKKYIDKKVLS